MGYYGPCGVDHSQMNQHETIQEICCVPPTTHHMVSGRGSDGDPFSPPDGDRWVDSPALSEPAGPCFPLQSVVPAPAVTGKGPHAQPAPPAWCPRPLEQRCHRGDRVTRGAMLETWVRKIPWRSEWQPTPVFLPGESHGQRSLVGYSPDTRLGEVSSALQ